MSAHDPSTARGGWIRKFGRRATDQPIAAAAASGEPPSSVAPPDRRRERLLEDISSFLLTHRLPVGPFTLDAAYRVVTGADRALACKVEAQVQAMAPITLGWLETATGAAAADEAALEVHLLANQLEAALATFGRTATAARSATTDYNCALEAHVGGLATDETEPAALADLAHLAREMLARTREVELELARSERETRDLERRLAEARRDAEIDHLTQLPNRRAFEAVFRAECAACHASEEPLCVAFCDIDSFKRINDVHGHEAGDRVLRTVARTLATISDERCHVARHGGEEFVVLLRGRPIDEALTVLDSAREAMASRVLVNRSSDRPFGRITFSGGIAEVAVGTNPRAALRAADAALLRAKESGRNRILAAGPEDG